MAVSTWWLIQDAAAVVCCSLIFRWRGRSLSGGACVGLLGCLGILVALAFFRRVRATPSQA